ncbi:hypothetical protein Pfo_028271 [Paulownia fortunei]|nr:hypothetical protein Pfo_028271 [Paulownia fortunei]
MEKFIPPEFDLPLKGRSEEALKRWREAVGKLVKNRRRRFRYAAVLEKRSEAKEQMRRLRENIRVCFVAYTAALRFIDGIFLLMVSNSPDKLASIVSSYDIKTLRKLKGVEGLADRLNVSLDKGVNSSEVPTRQNIFGPNRYTENAKSFWLFVWEALHDMTLVIRLRCGWPKGMYDGLGIILSIFLVVMVTAVSDYKQSLQFKEDGIRQKVSIYDLVVGDIVHLSIGDQVPADGIFVSGHNLLIDQSSLTGERTKVQDGSGKMLVTTVGMRTEWGKLMETLAFLVEKGLHHEFTIWSSSDALKLLNYFATAVTIIVVAVPEGLPLAVTLSLAFAMKKLMNDKALVRHLSACETMGSATCICTDKTGTLTTNHMVVTKIWICGKAKEVDASVSGDTLDTDISEHVLNNKDGKRSILGTPTESAILEYGLLLGGDFEEQRRVCKLLKVEPFNSEKKMMSVLVALPDGKIRAFCKGASEIVLKMCDRVINANGEPVPMSEEQVSNVMDVINGFACEALRTLCLAFKDIDDGIMSGYVLIGVVGIKDPVRRGVKEAVKTYDDLAIEGPDFRQKTPYEMSQLIPKLKHVLVKISRSILKEVVAVTGDGTNDAPALHEADIGLAMGIAGTEVSKWGRSVYINIQKFVQFQLTVNIVALMINFISACVSGTFCPISSLTAVQLLWVNLIMDTLGALALATEPPHDGLMRRPPVGRTESFITRTMWRNIIGQSIYQLAVLLVLNFVGKQILDLEVFNEINSRDIEKINIFRGMFGNWIFTGIIASTVVFQVIIVEFLGTFASTVPLSWQLWLLSVVLGAVSMPIAVVLKCIPVDTKTAAAAKQHDGYD